MNALLKIEAVVVKVDEGREDKIVWEGESDGDFTVSRAYRRLCESRLESDDPVWDRVWNLKTQ